MADNTSIPIKTERIFPIPLNISVLEKSTYLATYLEPRGASPMTLLYFTLPRLKWTLNQKNKIDDEADVVVTHSSVITHQVDDV